MRQLLVPVDFSPVTAAVLDHAARIAAGFAAEVTLLHVAAPEPEFVGYDAGPETVRSNVASGLRQVHRDLQELADDLRGRGIEAHAVCVQGSTVDVILERAQRMAADLIVLGSHGHGALYRALMGSVSEGVLRGASCPVLIVPARPPAA